MVLELIGAFASSAVAPPVAGSIPGSAQPPNVSRGAGWLTFIHCHALYRTGQCEAIIVKRFRTAAEKALYKCSPFSISEM